eukprot:gi/632980871/ref/XP_007907276.1/ PREDICTED: uncharacterized protein LOC103188910 [Callorhinchus milii]
MVANLDMANVLFFDQEGTKRVFKRAKRSPEELKAAMRYQNISSHMATIIQKLTTRKKRSSELKPSEQEDVGKKGKVPRLQRKKIPRKISDEGKTQLEEEEQNDQFEELKANAPNLLRNIERMFYYCKIFRIPYPGGLENILSYSWSDLVKGTSYNIKGSTACQSLIKPGKHTNKSGSPDRMTDGTDKGGAKKKLVSETQTDTEIAGSEKEKPGKRKKTKKNLLKIKLSV